MRKAALVVGWVSLLHASAGALAQPGPPAVGSTALAAAPGQFVVGAEALAWWLQASPTPAPLVTDGLVGNPNTRVFLGGGDVDTGTNGGVRITLGYGVRSDLAVEGNVFYLPRRSTHAGVSSTGKLGSIDLMVPYIDALTGRESATEISFAPVYKGIVDLDYSNELWGAEVNAAWSLPASTGSRFDVVGGFRYLRLNERYAMTTDSSYNPPYPQDIWLTSDRFETTNDFYGLQAGIRGRYEQGSFFATGSAKLALGAMSQEVSIDGSLVTNDYTDFGPTATYRGAYFAMPTNMGTHRRTVFAAIPEIGFNLGWRLTPAATVTLGYSLLYVSSVVRPGNQVDRTINWTQTTAYTEDPNATLKGPPAPAFRFNDSTFWAQGVSVGLAVRF